MRAYIINLDRAPERWEHIKKSFQTSSLEICRVAAIDGRELKLPCSFFNERRFHYFHGRRTNIYEVACSLSHLKAIEQFLATDEPYAMIAEDDIFFKNDFESLLSTLMDSASRWNILRLTGLSQGHPLMVKKLTKNYDLMLHMGRLKGCGAYLIDRKAAQIFVEKLLPIWLPWDHAMDREWFFGLHSLAVSPFPISQTDEKFQSAIQKNSQPPFPSWRRWLTTYPYQVFNELSRWLFRGGYFLLLKLRAKI